MAYQDGQIIDNGYEVSDYVRKNVYTLRQPDVPVAVLIGPMTANSGEITALAFVGRDKTRFFGEPSSGQTTVTQGLPLFDSTVL